MIPLWYLALTPRPVSMDLTGLWVYSVPIYEDGPGSPAMCVTNVSTTRLTSGPSAPSPPAPVPGRSTTNAEPRNYEHHEALDALGNRWIGILHGCLKHATPYDEHTARAHRHFTAA